MDANQNLSSLFAEQHTNLIDWDGPLYRLYELPSDVNELTIRFLSAKPRSPWPGTITDPPIRQTGVRREARQVTALWVHEDTLVDLQVEGGAVVTTTEDHPFWNATDHGFQRADQLDPGDDILTADGQHITVRGLVAGSQRRALAYNLTVDGIHTYFVGIGHNSALVHNTCDVRGLWTITKEGTAATKQGPFGTVSKSKSDGLWWSREHGWSRRLCLEGLRRNLSGPRVASRCRSVRRFHRG